MTGNVSVGLINMCSQMHAKVDQKTKTLFLLFFSGVKFFFSRDTLQAQGYYRKILCRRKDMLVLEIREKLA